MRRVGDAKARRQRSAVIVGNAGHNSVASESGIQALVTPGSCEKTEGCVVAQAGVQRKRWFDAPGILGVETEAADAVRKGAVSGAGGVNGGTVRIGSHRIVSR